MSSGLWGEGLGEGLGNRSRGVCAKVTWCVGSTSRGVCETLTSHVGCGQTAMWYVGHVVRRDGAAAPTKVEGVL